MSICYNVPLYLVTLIIFWSYYVFTYLYCIDYLINVAYKIILLIFYNIFFFLFVWCLWATALIRMYEVPFQYQVSARDHLILVQMKEADRHRILVDVCLRSGLRIYTRTPSGYLRYCTVCQHIKPDRTHHCTVCGRCVLKMDHHCPFVNNCVGLANYKHFVLMLLYGFIYTMYFASCTFPVVLKFCQLNSSAHKNYKQIQIVTGWLLTFAGSMFLNFFMCRHFLFILKNQTSWEANYAPLFENSALTFDVTPCKNFTSVFGERPLHWFCPRQVLCDTMEDNAFPVREMTLEKKLPKP